MKKKLVILLVIYSLALLSCSEDFNINTPNKDVYVLNCILRNDNSTQYAVVSKNIYTENGALPTSNCIDQNIKGADVRIFYNDSMFVMRDTTIQITEGDKETKVECYYVNNLNIRPGKIIRIEAVMPDGQILKSITSMHDISYSFYSEFPQKWKSRFRLWTEFNWHWVGDNEKIKNILCLPQVEIYYKKYEGGSFVNKKVLIPIAPQLIASHPDVDENGIILPVEINLSFHNLYSTTLETITKTMLDISGDDPNKKDYIINKVLFNVVCLDSKLSRYYSAQRTYSEGVSIKLRETDCSNIEGGKGIFGIYYKFSKYLVIDDSYVNSFGYKYDPRQQ